MRQDTILALLGLAQRAGRVKSGGFAVEQSIKGGKARLVVLAEDGSESSKKSYRDMCAYRSVPVREYGNKEALGGALGKEERAAAAVEDNGFAQKLVKLIDGGRGTYGENQ